jgi:hypothetical protein
MRPALVSRVVMNSDQRVIVGRDPVTMLGTIMAEVPMSMEPRPVPRSPEEGERDSDGNRPMHRTSLWKALAEVNRRFHTLASWMSDLATGA